MIMKRNCFIIAFILAMAFLVPFIYQKGQIQKTTFKTGSCHIKKVKLITSNKSNGLPKLKKDEIISLDPLNKFTVSPFTAKTGETSSLDMSLSTSTVERSEVHHIAFLKVHKAASSTMLNIFYRFGHRRNLTFVLPKHGHIISNQKYRYKDVLPSKSQSGKYDIIGNHVVFNHEYFTQYMYSDAVYIAIVREPFSLFVSAAMYFKPYLKYLKKMPRDSFIRDLIEHPEIHERTPLRKSWTFNFMTRDFGFILSSVEEARNISNAVFDSFLASLEKVFDFVLVVEQFDESLVMLKRKLNWSTKDVIYIKQKAGHKRGSKPKFGREVMEKFKEHHRFDFKIYDLFAKKLERKIEQESTLKEEVESFKSILLEVKQFCTMKKDAKMMVKKTPWNEEFYVTMADCQLMLLKIRTFCYKLKRDQANRSNNSIR